ncbi:hydroxypyruvate isomerase family protein [Flagellimonas sediminis]|uniref:TIM barrel protein n=1 Tax=Flagellimonas sediminis TaxID=2696468 RepID=A0A6I5KW74_9FLAO|nr:TIM barrel protein [Allomuricauda sediminis]NDV44823.1 TIM barrel protein [Allomuricauda sediminis]
MNRRDFVKRKMMLSTALGLGGVGVLSATERPSSKGQKGFNLNYAPHLGMFRESAGTDPIDQLNFMADMGFTAFEDNEMKGRDKSLQEKMARTMMERGITMGVFVAHEIYWNKPNLANGDASLREKFLKEIKESIEVAKRVNAKWMTVVPGHVDLRLREAYQTANVIESLKQACSLLEPHGLTMVLEPLNFRDHPGLFLTDSPQAFEICKSVDSPSCKILFDIYHQQIQEGNLIPNIDACWDEIGYFQVGDNPGRNEPTTGEINFKNVFKHIHSKGFVGIVGMEHGNSMEGKEGEQAVIEAYRATDSF